MMAMATPAMRMAFMGPSVLPRLLSPTLFSAYRVPQIPFRRISLPFLPSLSFAIPAGFQLGLPSIPSLLEGIWEGILKAVPKKKTSHSKKRHRQMAGKALKEVTELCKCPACGSTKKMHHLCPMCLSRLQGYMQKNEKKIKYLERDSEQIQALEGDSEQVQALERDSEQIQALERDSEQIQALERDPEQIQALERDSEQSNATTK